MKSFHKTFSSKWEKKMRKCSFPPSPPPITFWVLSRVSNNLWGSELKLTPASENVCIRMSFSCACDPTFTLIFSVAGNIHACQLYLWYVLETRMGREEDYRGSRLKTGPAFLGTLAQLWSSVPILVGAVCPSCVLP